MRDAKAKLLTKLLKSEGFLEMGGTKHLKMGKLVNGKNIIVVLPPSGTIKSKTVERIRKQAEIEKSVFYSYKF